MRTTMICSGIMSPFLRGVRSSARPQNCARAFWSSRSRCHRWRIRLAALRVGHSTLCRPTTGPSWRGQPIEPVEHLEGSSPVGALPGSGVPQQLCIAKSTSRTSKASERTQQQQLYDLRCRANAGDQIESNATVDAWAMLAGSRCKSVQPRVAPIPLPKPTKRAASSRFADQRIGAFGDRTTRPFGPQQHC